MVGKHRKQSQRNIVIAGNSTDKSTPKAGRNKTPVRKQSTQTIPNRLLNRKEIAMSASKNQNTPEAKKESN